MIEVTCNMTKCLYYHYEERTQTTFCKHTSKPKYMQKQPCPLFQLKWDVSGVNPQDYLKIFSKRR